MNDDNLWSPMCNCMSLERAGDDGRFVAARCNGRIGSWSEIPAEWYAGTVQQGGTEVRYARVRFLYSTRTEVLQNVLALSLRNAKFKHNYRLDFAALHSTRSVRAFPTNQLVGRELHQHCHWCCPRTSTSNTGKEPPRCGKAHWYEYEVRARTV